QELIVREDDCGTNRGLWLEDINADEPGHRYNLDTRLYGRVLAEDVTAGGKKLKAGTMMGEEDVAILRDETSVERVRVRSVLTCDDETKGRTVTIVGDDGSEESYAVSTRDLSRMLVGEGQEIAAGEALVEGPKDPKELLEIKGIRETQQYLVDEVQKVYRDQ